MASEAGQHHRGPKRSSAIPTGICAAANTRKNALDSNPRSAADNCNSAARLGAITATELRRNWLITYMAMSVPTRPHFILSAIGAIMMNHAAPPPRIARICPMCGVPLRMNAARMMMAAQMITVLIK